MEMFCIQVGAKRQSRDIRGFRARSVIAYQWLWWRLGLALLSSLYLPSASAAQESTAPEQSPREVEEMVITGGSSLHQIRAQMLAEQKRVYETFNRFNDEDRFNVSCGLHAPTGTRLREQVCLPRFVREAASDHGRYYWETYRAFLDPYTEPENVYYTHAPMQTQIASQQEAFREKMREVAREHPEFVETLARYSEVVERYRTATERNAD